MTAGLARAGAATFAGTVLGTIVTFVLTGVVVQNLDADATGYYFQIVALFAITSNALQLGADTALVRTLSAQAALGQRGALPRTVWTALVPVAAVGLLLGGGVWLAADPLSGILSAGAGTISADLIRSVAPFVASGSMVAVLLGGTRGLGGTLPYTVLQHLALPFLRLGLVSAVVLAGFGLAEILAAWAAPTLVVAAAAAVILVRQLRRLRGDAADSAVPVTQPGAAGRFWRFALPRCGSTLIERLLDWSGVLLVIALAGPALGGIYAVVARCATAGLMLDQAARIVTGPRISRALALDDRGGAASLFLTVTRTMILVTWPLYLLLVVFSPAVLALFGPEFLAGAPALSLIAAVMMFASAAGMVQSVLLMGGRSSWQLFNRGIQLTTMVSLTIVLVPPLGLMGAALAWAAAITVDTALATTQVALRMGIRTSLRRIALPAGIAVVVFAGGGFILRTILGATPVALLIALPVLGIPYLAIAFLLRRALGLAELLNRPNEIDRQGDRTQGGAGPLRQQVPA